MKYRVWMPYVFEDTTWPGHGALLGALIVVRTVKVHIVIPSFVTLIVIAKAATVHLQNKGKHHFTNSLCTKQIKENVVLSFHTHTHTKKNSNKIKSTLQSIYVIYTMHWSISTRRAHFRTITILWTRSKVMLFTKNKNSGNCLALSVTKRINSSGIPYTTYVYSFTQMIQTESIVKSLQHFSYFIKRKKNLMEPLGELNMPTSKYRRGFFRQQFV